MAMQSKLLDPEFIEKLEQLSVAAKCPLSERTKGEKHIPRHASSVNQADRRAPQNRDDLRYVDWKAFARLERLFLKLFVEEEDLSIHLLIDASQSMMYPVEMPDGKLTKFDYARKLAAILGYVGLIRYDRVNIATFSQTVGRRVPVLRGRGAVPQLLKYLDELSGGGNTDFVQALRNYATRHAPSGVCIVLSDFFDPNWERGVRALLSQRFQVVLLQILAPEEVEPNLIGDLRLVDAETGESREISITSSVVTNYREAFDRFCSSLADLSHRQGMDYLRTTTDSPVESILLNTLHNAGLLPE